MSYLWIKVRVKEKNRVLVKCYKNKLFIYNSKEDQKYFYFKIKSSDKYLLKKVCSCKIKIMDETGWPKIKKYLKKYLSFILAFIVGLIIFFCLTHIIVDVKIIHSNKEIRDLLTTALEQKGIKKNTWKKSYSKLQEIKDQILKLYPEKLEWLEIETKGMNYIVRLEERKIISNSKAKSACNVVAIKDGLIKKIIYNKGEALVKTNDYVKKGDILIEGTLKKDDEIKNTVCAEGKVYAEVWYQATIKVPITKEENILTGKVRYNIKIKNNAYDDFLFKSRLKEYTTDNYPLFTLFNTTFFWSKQKEVTKKTITYTDEELNALAEKLVNEKINQLLNDNEYIIDKKVLQKNKLTNSFEVKYFVVLLEQIGEQQSF